VIKKINEGIKIPKNASLNEMSDKQLKALITEAKFRLNEMDFESRPRERRVGDSPEPKGKDLAMAAVSDAYRKRMLASERSEQLIKQYPEPAYYYATRVLRDRWKEAEDTIRSNPQWWKKYKRFVKSLPSYNQIRESKELKESPSVRAALNGEMRNIEWMLEGLEMKLSEASMVRRAEALKGDVKERYTEVQRALKEAITEVGTLIKVLEKTKELSYESKRNNN
jgi:hypothetical protein